MELIQVKKRFISFIAAARMITGMVPAVSAAEVTYITNEQSSGLLQIIFREATRLRMI